MKRRKPDITHDEWQAALNAALTPKKHRDYSRGLSAREWNAVAEKPSRRVQNLKFRLDQAVAAKTMVKEDYGSRSVGHVYRLADEKAWAKSWPKLKAILEGSDA